jgi:hypothetical protein
MPFNDEFLLNASNFIEVKSITTDFEIVKDYLKKAIAKLSKFTSNKVKEKDIDIYFHGSYANATNTYFPSNLEVAVELRVPEYDYIMESEYYIQHRAEYGPKSFRQHLFSALSEVIESETKTAKVAGIEISTDDKCIIIPKHGNLKHIVEIMPCISFIMKEEGGAEHRGVLLHNAGTDLDIATFPKLHQKNGQAKDLKCAGNFKRMVRLLKTLNSISARENQDDELLNCKTRGYFIECLLYNVPDQLYIDSNIGDVFLRIMNYLSHIDISNFACQNLVWLLFGKAGEFWSEKEAYSFITSTKVLYRQFPVTRTTLI